MLYRMLLLGLALLFFLPATPGPASEAVRQPKPIDTVCCVQLVRYIEEKNEYWVLETNYQSPCLEKYVAMSDKVLVKPVGSILPDKPRCYRIEIPLDIAK